ncbi:hypothetical protein JS756_03150 [Streptomyces actuosus]|uniref:Uncharacterized protein n=1 Tax=Streptomyces actuosus TaxID=1885 RepID=A0ABS2VJ80_STRAS|nr:hypothetical protein [Streptomyces actuosus]MBN0043127.1 hypothetical protein [Streptomyces actuosus]
MAFPVTPLDIGVDLRVGGVWTDVTAEVYTRDLMTIVRGRRDEGVRSDPGRCTLTFNNRNGKYSPGNPMSPYYGLIGRNTQVRVHVPAGEAHLELDGDASGTVSTPHTGALDITGDLDVRVELDCDMQSTTTSHIIIGKWGETNTDRSWNIRYSTGYLVIQWLNASAVSGAAFIAQHLYGGAALRVTLDVDNGAGGYTCRFYQADSIDGPWTQIYSDLIGSDTTSVQSTTSPLTLGANDSTTTPVRQPFEGTATRFQLRDGIDGTLVAAPDFRSLADGATSFTDSTGLTWTVNGTAQVRKRADRFVGEISAWPPRWDVSGNDVWTPVEAAGILRRYGQGTALLSSPLTRRVPTFNPLAYWPMEDGAQSTQAGSPIPGVQPMPMTGVTWAQSTSLISSAPLPVLTSAGGALPTMRGLVPAPTTATTGWQTIWLYRLDTAPTTLRTFMTITATGTVRTWYVQSRNDASRVLGLDGDGATVVDVLIGTGSDLFNQWTSCNLRTSESGGTVTWAISWQDVGGDFGTYSSSYSGTAGTVSSVSSPPDGYSSDLDGMALGHIAVFGTFLTNAYVNAITAWQGDPAGERALRLAGEEDLPLTVRGIIAEQELMGAQGLKSLLDLVGECADSDGGILMEHRARAALRIRGRATLYNQAPALTLDYTADGEVAPPLEPTDDDADVTNDVTVRRIDGSSGRAVLADGALSVQMPPDGIGRYDSSVDLSLDSDDQAEPIAYWRLHLGTWDGPRYPVVHVDLAAAPHLIDDALAVDQGDLIRITNPPPWVPPGDIDLIVQGYTESFDQYSWDVYFVCTPAGPWSVAEVDSRVDTDGSELAAGVDETATSLSVAVTDGPLWITSSDYPGDFPFDAILGGERVTVTGITGSSSPQAWAVIRSVNGISKTHASGTDVPVAEPAIVPL